jgi:DNA-binding transcriptional LysR family regulator
MRVEHVRAFVALAEELNFRRAAARLFVSQPTLTAQIHQLERSLGVVLFDRGPGGTRVTDAGEELLPVAREVLRALDDLVDVAGGRTGARANTGHRRRVRIGVGPGGVGAATWPALQAFAARRRDLDLAVVSLAFTTALPALDRGEVEAVLLHGPVDELGRRRVTTVGCVPVAVLVPTHHWLAGAPSLAVDDVVPHVRAVPPPEMGAAFTRFWLLTDHRLSPSVGVRLDGEETLAMAREVARQGFVGFWPSDVVVPASSGAVVRPLAERRWAPLQVVTREGWAPADDLVAAATGAVAAAGGFVAPGADGAVLPPADQEG